MEASQDVNSTRRRNRSENLARIDENTVQCCCGTRIVSSLILDENRILLSGEM